MNPGLLAPPKISMKKRISIVHEEDDEEEDTYLTNREIKDESEIPDSHVDSELESESSKLTSVSTFSSHESELMSEDIDGISDSSDS